MYRLVTVPDMPASFVETTFHVRYAETDQMGIVHRFLSSTFFLQNLPISPTCKGIIPILIWANMDL